MRSRRFLLATALAAALASCSSGAPDGPDEGATLDEAPSDPVDADATEEEGDEE